MREHVADRLSLVYTVTGGYFMAVDNDRRCLLNLIDPEEDGDPADLVRTGTGLPDLRLRVVDHREWTLVPSWPAPTGGQVFLAGEAVHPMTPYGGFGMNCSVQDVDNLAWKLAGVLAGWTWEELLDTYDPERRPVGSAMGEPRKPLVALPGCEGGRPSDGLVLGYAYQSSAMIPDGTPLPDGDPVADFVPSARPASPAVRVAGFAVLARLDGKRFHAVDRPGERCVAGRGPVDVRGRAVALPSDRGGGAVRARRRGPCWSDRTAMWGGG